MQQENPVQEMREQINELDRELLRVVAHRMSLVRSIGAAKGSDRPILDPGRELAMSERWSSAAAEEGIAAVLTTRILREVLNHSRRVQEIDRDSAGGYRLWARTIGYQGQPGAYSELAARKLLAIPVDTIGFRTFADVTSALERGDVDCALLPIENTLMGGVAETTTLLVEQPVTILDEELSRIRHCLASVSGTTLEAIRTVRSHAVALQQCRKTLAAFECEVFFDTAGAAEAVALDNDPTVAALCSAEAAERNGLVVLARDLEDDPHNFTRFILLARADDARLDVSEVRPPFSKTSVVLATANRPGALARCLQALAMRGINLTRLESRARPPWEYLFLIDFEGHRDEPRVQAALAAIRADVEELRILGSYPNRTSSPEHLPEPAVSEPPRAATIVVSEVPLAHRVQQHSVVHVGDVAFGEGPLVLIAGPCAVESREQIRDAAHMAKERGAQMLRGGAFKPRTSPYSFQGLGAAGIDLIVDAAREVGLPVVTEVLDVRHLESVAARVDMIQVGARNMQNFELLKELGRINKPVLLKRGMSATLDELLHACEYILVGGNQQVVLCERGIRTFERSTRNTLDIAAVPLLKQRTHLPVIVDPSHAAGRRDLVIPLALAAAAVGADGLIVEAHPRPDEALSDKEQALGPDELTELVRCLNAPNLVSSRA